LAYISKSYSLGYGAAKSIERAAIFAESTSISSAAYSQPVARSFLK
jgi:hypothetical protein